MFCNNCGAKLEDDALFCHNCGNRVANVPETPEEDEKTVILSDMMTDASADTVPEAVQEAATELEAAPEKTEVTAEQEAEVTAEQVAEAPEETVKQAKAEMAAEPAKVPEETAFTQAGEVQQEAAEPEPAFTPAGEAQPTVNAAAGGESSAMSGAPAGQPETVEAVEISPTGMMESNTAVAMPGGYTQKKFCPNCGTENDINDVFCKECGMFFGNAAEKMGAGTKAKGKGNGNGAKNVLFIAIPAVILVFLVVLGCLIVPRLMNSSGQKAGVKDYILYVKDNELMMAKGKKFEPALIGERCCEDKDYAGSYVSVASYTIQFSSDNKYIYYPHNLEDDYTYDLYRRQLDSKKAGEEKIDTNVLSFQIFDKDKVAYIKDSADRKLYLYQNGETAKLASDVSWMDVSGDGKYVIWESGGVDSKLYVQDTAMKEDKIRLESDVTALYDYSENLDTIVYEKDDNLYVLKNLEEKEKIASDVYDVYVCGIESDLKIYYAKEGDATEISLYDLVEDDLYAQDQMITEPDIRDYQTSRIVNGYFGPQEQIETDDSYYDDYYEYEEKLYRDSFREELKWNTNELETMELYYYDGKEDSSSKVIETSLFPGTWSDMFGETTAFACFWDFDIEDKQLFRFSELMAADEDGSMEDYFEDSITDSMEEYLHLMYVKDGELFQLDGIYDLDDIEEGFDCLDLAADEETHTMYMTYDRETSDGWCSYLYRFDYNEAEPHFELISEDVDVISGIYKTGIYYVNEDEELYCNDTKLGDDVYAYSVEIQEDGTVLYLSDIDKTSSEGTLHIYAGGESYRIADDVAVYSYQIFNNGMVTFLSDYNYKKSRGDLKVYDGKNIIQVDSDVTGIIE